MRSLLYILAAAAVMGLAFWAYRENYRTQDALAEVERLQQEIGTLRETQTVLAAEWAYLNRPDRLRELAELNFDKLALMPLQPEQFGGIDQATYPTPEIPEALDASMEPVDVAGVLPEAAP